MKSNKEEAAGILGKLLTESMKPVVDGLARTLAEAYKDVIPENEREKAIAEGAARMLAAMEPGLVEYVGEILQLVEVAQASTIDAVLKVIAEEGESARSDEEFKFLVRIVRALETGAWKKHVPEQRA